MKLRTITFLFAIISSASFAQKACRLEMETSVKDSLLKIELFVKNTGKEAFALGSSDFVISVPQEGLDLSKTRFKAGVFDKNVNAAYEQMGYSFDKFLVAGIRTDVSGKIKGELLDSVRRKIFSFEIPVKNPCETVLPALFRAGVVQEYSKSGRAIDLTRSLYYADPTPVKLDGGLSETIPQVTLKEGKLNSSSAVNNQWYLDNVAIPGADKPSFIPQAEGEYKVEVTYPCSKNMSQSQAVAITGFNEFADLYAFKAGPNPFVSECRISYHLKGSSRVRLQVYSISGEFLTELHAGDKMKGQYETSFNPSSLGLVAGTYILKLMVNNQAGNVKLVALK